MDTEDLAFYDHPSVRPIKKFLLDPEITEIMINGPERIFIERHGRMELLPLRFRDREQLQQLVDRLMEPTGRSISTSAPYADFRLPDGSRVNVIIPPIALDGAAVTIRKFTRTFQVTDDLIAVGALSPRMADLLAAAVRGRLNLIFSGATGTGKTTALGVLSGHIDADERILTIEDTAELQLQQKHVVRLECRPPNQEGRGNITMGELVRNALRMRPTRIIVGEIRGEEAVDMLQAIATGHEGCLAVLHASSPGDAIRRLEVMVQSRGLQLPLWAVHRQIHAAIDLIVQHEMLPDGQRKITRITELTALAEDRIELHDLFRYQAVGTDAHGKETGEWVCHGVQSDILTRCARRGITIGPEIVAPDAPPAE